MPRLDIDGYELRIYASDVSSITERPHVHIWHSGRHAKYWIDRIEHVTSTGYANQELTAIERMLRKNRKRIMQEWNRAKKTV